MTRFKGRLAAPLWVALAVVALAGCGDVSRVAGAATGALDGEWRLASGTVDGQPLGLLDTSPITLEVSGAEASGRSACNSYSGSFNTDDVAVRVSGLGGTDMACEPDVMTLESAYLRALGLVDTGAVVADQLTLSGSGAELVYEPVAAPGDTSFTSTQWLLESLVAGGGADGTVSSTAATAEIRFDDDGTFTGSTGCGPVIGEWRLVEGQVETTLGHPTHPPGDIRPAPCFPDATAQYRQVMAVLGGPFSATISGDVLTLTAGDGSGLGYRAQPTDPAGAPASDPSLDGMVTPTPSG